MAVTPLPALDRTASTFKTDVDTFFAQKLPTFSQEVNTVASAADASATAANTSKNAAATSATNAATSATNASNSATAANTSKMNAATSETNAAASATAANTSKNAAAGSATAAASSATNSEASAVRAKTAADSIASGPVTSVNGKTGAPVLNKTDIGLPLVDNLSIRASGIGLTELQGVPDIDSNTITNGWYGVYDTATLGTRPLNLAYGILQVTGYNMTGSTYTRVSQTFYIVDGPAYRTFGRKNAAGTWTPWEEVTRPSKTNMKRRPLTPSEDTLSEVWSHILSIPLYLDKSVTATAAASQALDLSSYSIFDYLLSVATTFSISNLPGLSGETLTFVVRIRQGSSALTVTWFSGITWLTSGGVAPVVPAAGKIVEYVFSTINGTSWYGRVGAST